jgi:hypothetical protein
MRQQRIDMHCASTTRTFTSAAVATVLIVSGCSTAPEQSTKSSTNYSTMTTTTKPANFDFPDLSAYVPADLASYEQINVPRTQGFRFSTPSGLICASNAYPDSAHERASCRGPLPEKGVGDWSVSVGRTSAATVESITGDPDFQEDKINPPPLLPAMHRLSADKGDAVCAVDDKGMAACRVGDHGFVVTPTSTNLF